MGLYIAEGPTCFLAACCAWGEGSDSAPAVLGIDAGSWTPAFAARVPSGTAVFVATDLNPAGDNYARKINRDLGGRCEVRRIARWWRAGMPDKTPDVADLGVGGFVSVPMEPPPALEPRGRPAQPPGPSWAEVTRGVPRLVADALRDARPERALLVEVPTSAGKTEAALRAFAELPDLPPVRVYLAQSHKLLSEEADRLARLGFPEERMRRYEGLAHACRLGLRSPRRAWHCPKCPEKPACLAWSFTIPDDGEPVVVLMPHAAASQIEERWTRTAEEGGLGLDLGDLVAVWDELPAVVEVQTIRPEDLEPKECAGAGVGRTLALALAALRAAGERCAQEVEPGDWGESAELERFLRAEADLAALDRCAGAPLEELLTRTGSMGGRSTLAEYLRSGGSLPIRLDTVEALRLVLAEHTLLVSLPGPTWQAEIRRPVQVPPCATVYLSATAEYEEAELRGALRRRNVDLEIRGV